jgi:hypothetical protein
MKIIIFAIKKFMQKIPEKFFHNSIKRIIQPLSNCVVDAMRVSVA